MSKRRRVVCSAFCGSVGETVALFVDVHVPSNPASTVTSPLTESHGSESSTPASPTTASAVTALRRRWKKHCESARVEIRVVEENGTPTKPKAPRTTLFHQEAQLELVQDARKEASEDDSKGHGLLTFRSDVVPKVRSEYWNRPLKLLVRITPPVSNTSGGATTVAHDAPATVSFAQLDPFASTSFFTEQFQQDHVLRLIREETMAPEPLTRSVERQISIVKPLQLKMETRYLSKERVCIIAKATNTHAQLELKILDLHLHLNESYSTFSSDANSSQPQSGRLKGQKQSMSTTRRPQRQFRIVNDAQEQFPIRIRGAEQFNFLFILEAIETKSSVEGEGGDGGAAGNDASEHASRAGDVQDERAASMSKHRAPTNTAMKRHSSSGSVTSASITVNAASSAIKSAKRIVTSGGGGQTQQTLLTLTWEACASPCPTEDGNSSQRETRRLLAPITEYHTIIWSPHSVSIEVRQVDRAWMTASPSLPLFAFTDLLARNGNNVGDVSVEYMSKQCPLNMSLAPPSSSQQSIRVGKVVTLCVVITNRSQHTSFDLTLLSPFTTQEHPAAAANGHANHEPAQHYQDATRGPGWLSFEATHRLGYVPFIVCCSLTLRLINAAHSSGAFSCFYWDVIIALCHPA